MTAAERARRWFQRHAQRRTDASGNVVAFGVDWSEEVEASLAAAFAVAITDGTKAVLPATYDGTIPAQEPWPNRTRSNWAAPGCQSETDVETWP